MVRYIHFSFIILSQSFPSTANNTLVYLLFSCGFLVYSFTLLSCRHRTLPEINARFHLIDISNEWAKSQKDQMKGYTIRRISEWMNAPVCIWEIGNLFIAWYWWLETSNYLLFKFSYVIEKYSLPSGQDVNWFLENCLGFDRLSVGEWMNESMEYICMSYSNQFFACSIL